MKIKICGQTSLDDCLMSIRYGADYIGVVLNVDWSARSLDIARARPIFEKLADRAFMLTFNMPLEPDAAEAAAALEPYAIQLTGQETPAHVSALRELTKRKVFKSIHLSAEGGGRDDPGAVVALMNEYTNAGVDGFILDTAVKEKFGGTGVKSDWAVAGQIAAAAPRPVFLAGGVNPGNVAEAARVPGVYGIDLASGVETAPGVKSEEKLRALFSALANADV